MVAWPYMVYSGYEQPSDEEVAVWKQRITQRYNLFGGLPGYLLNDSKADERLSKPRNVAVSLLSLAMMNGGSLTTAKRSRCKS